jgi:membrane-bound lytic murein transglycosylase C
MAAFYPKVLALPLIVLSALPLLAQEKDKDPLDRLDKEFSRFVQSMELDRRAFLDESDKEYQAFVRQIERSWGTFVPSSRPVWSSYSSDLAGHGEANFDTGDVLVQVVADPETLASEEKLIGKLAGQLDAMMSSENPAARDVLEDLIDGGDGTAIKQKDAADLLKRRINDGKVERRTLHTSDGNTRVIVSVRLPMVPDHLARAARPFLGSARKRAEQFALGDDLVLAVIHTESWFNPLARSSAPAYGLMQLVPTSGGRDAWQSVHGTVSTPSVDTLYDPEQNVELGCAYLRVLLDRDFSRFSEPESRILAAIAAYNSGPGNVRKALRILDHGAGIPVGVTPEQVRSALLARAPEETRQYIRLVTERRQVWRGGQSR